VDLRVVVIHRVGGQFSEEVRVTSGVPQGSVLGPLLFLACVNDIWRNIESTIRLFADDCIIYRKIINNKDMEKLQMDLNRQGSLFHKSLSDRITKLFIIGHSNSGSKQL
jgi:hypothetical protein